MARHDQSGIVSPGGASDLEVPDALHAPMEPPPCCPQCAVRSADQGLAVAAAKAAREAVSSAVAELRPALLQLLSEVRLEAAREVADGGRPEVGPASNKAGPRPPSPEAMSPRSSSPAAPDNLGGEPRGRPRCRARARSAATQFSSECSKASVASPASSRATLARIPSVSSAQACIAQAVLEQCRVGFLRAPPQQRAARWPLQRSSDALGAVAQARGLRIVPMPDERLDVPPRAGDEPRRTFAQQRGDSFLSPAGSEFSVRSSESAVDSAEDRVVVSGEEDEVTPPPIVARRMTSEQVLRSRIQQLAREAAERGQPAAVPLAPARRVAPLALLFSGVLPWDGTGRGARSCAYQCCVRVVVLLAVGLRFTPSISAGLNLPCGAVCRQSDDGFLSHLPLPAGAVLVLLTFALRRHQALLIETFELLQDVSAERGYLDWCVRKGRNDKIVFAALWLSIMVTHGLAADVHADLFIVLMNLALTAVFSSVILCVTYGLVRVCRTLSIMIDVFCCDTIGEMLPADIAHVWNLTQAVLRKSSNSVESSLLAVCLILVVLAPLLLVDIGLLESPGASALALAPGLLVACGILYMLFLAANISEQCANVPALVNALSFGEGTEDARQRTVDYIAASAAGFYVFGVRLTTAMVLKFMYIWCIIVVGLIRADVAR